MKLAYRMSRNWFFVSSPSSRLSLVSGLLFPRSSLYESGQFVALK